MAAVDVLLPVRNGAQFLQQAIGSVQSQTYSDWRLLVLDHGSSDGSLELADAMADSESRIAVFSLPDADGLAGLLNAGLQRCDCRFVMRQDADDISLPHRMSVSIEMFARNPDLYAVGGQAVAIDQHGQDAGCLHVPTGIAAVTAASLFYNPMLHPTITLDFAKTGGRPELYGNDVLNVLSASQSLAVRELAEDYFLFGQLSLLGACANIDAPLIKYRTHGGVGTSNRRAQIDKALQISRFLAASLCEMQGLATFDPGPFCNHAECVFDFGRSDYSKQFAYMDNSLRRALGNSAEVERELAFRRVLATRRSYLMSARFLRFALDYGSKPNEQRTVRNWLLRKLRNGKYVYRPDCSLHG